jgi:hypothetical protein
MESRASPPGWTGETPVPPPADLSFGQTNNFRINRPIRTIR